MLRVKWFPLQAVLFLRLNLGGFEAMDEWSVMSDVWHQRDLHTAWLMIWGFKFLQVFSYAYICCQLSVSQSSRDLILLVLSDSSPSTMLSPCPFHWQGNESNVKSKPFEVQGCWERMDGWMDGWSWEGMDGWMHGNVGSTSSPRIYVWSTNLEFSPGKKLCYVCWVVQSFEAMTRWGGSRYLFRRRRKCTTVPSWIKREMHKDGLRQIPNPSFIAEIQGAFRAAQAGRGFPSKGLWWLGCKGSGQGNRGKPPKKDKESFGCQASSSWLQEPSTPCSTRQEENMFSCNSWDVGGGFSETKNGNNSW